MNLLNLVRWKNLLIAGLTVLLMKYAVFEPAIDFLFPMSHSTLGDLETIGLALSVILIAAAGYIINDIHDVKADSLNKPDKVIINNGISSKLANNLYIILNISGVFLGAYIGKLAGSYKLALLHVVVAGLLWIYSAFIKNTFLIGNLVVALASGLVSMTYFFFESLGYIKEFGPVLKQIYRTSLGGPLELLYNYSLILALFAFGLTLVREIIKDLQDYKGDLFVGANTLPIFLGEKTAKVIVTVLVFGIEVCIGYILHLYLNETTPFNEPAFIIYTWLLLIAPFNELIWGVWKAKEPQDYQRPSNTAKFIMLTGVLTTLIYAFNV